MTKLQSGHAAGKATMARSRLYLDYNATAPLLPAARAAMIAAMDLPGNPSSVHAEGYARRVRHFANARRRVAGLRGVPATQHVVSHQAPPKPPTMC
jgi:cysteine desulfurase